MRGGFVGQISHSAVLGHDVLLMGGKKSFSTFANQEAVVFL